MRGLIINRVQSILNLQWFKQK